MVQSTDLAIVILAGGRARRFPDKLEALIDGEPLLARVYRNLRGVAPIVIAARATFSPSLDAVLDCPIIVDRWPERGPLGGLLSACASLPARRIFAVAGDAPHVTPDVLHALVRAWEDRDEAAVPECDGRLQPLVSLYDREALLREARQVLDWGNSSMHALVDRLRVRRIPLAAHYFHNINTPADLCATP
jgi:molybdopterin-guanine dinucleotide biosynthesis protein A